MHNGARGKVGEVASSEDLFANLEVILHCVEDRRRWGAQQPAGRPEPGEQALRCYLGCITSEWPQELRQLGYGPQRD